MLQSVKIYFVLALLREHTTFVRHNCTVSVCPRIARAELPALHRLDCFAMLWDGEKVRAVVSASLTQAKAPIAGTAALASIQA